MRLALCLLCAWAVLPELVSARPVERIVSLAPNLTELAFAAGAGDRIVGTVEYSNEPAAARKIPRIGDAFRVDVERILALRPDLVLAWETGTPAATIERLRTLGLSVREFDTQSLSDIPTVVRALGALASTEPVAERAADEFEARMSALAREFRDKPTLRVFLQVSTRPLYTVNGRQIMSEMLTICGARNIFEDLNQLAPQVGLEAVIARNPEAIVITDEAEPQAKQQWSKWRQIDAVKYANVYVLPADDLTRATTRLAHGAGELCRVLDTAREHRARQR